MTLYIFCIAIIVSLFCRWWGPRAFHLQISGRNFSITFWLTDLSQEFLCSSRDFQYRSGNFIQTKSQQSNNNIRLTGNTAHSSSLPFHDKLFIYWISTNSKWWTYYSDLTFSKNWQPNRNYKHLIENSPNPVWTINNRVKTAVLGNTRLEVAGVALVTYTLLKRAITLLNIPLRNSLLYSNTPEIFLLYSTRVTIFTSILYSTRVLKFQYFTQHWVQPIHI